MKKKIMFLIAGLLVLVSFFYHTEEIKAAGYGEDAYLTYGDFKYLHNTKDNYIMIVEYNGNAEEVCIPEAINGVQVRYMDAVFSGKRNIKKVHLPETLKYFGSFDGCVNLQEINIPQGIKVLPAYAFAECGKLKQISLPNGLERIGEYAFMECKSLKEIRIPDSVKTIYEGLFQDCTGLEKAVVSKNCESGIDAKMFYNCKKLKNINIPKNYTGIREEAFYGCKSLKQIKLPSKLKSIGRYAFAGTSISEITIPKGVEWFERGAFMNCKKLRKITIKCTKYYEVYKYAFYNIHPKAVFDVPNKHIAKYRKQLEQAKSFKGKTMKIK